ncbi:MAG: hypothetical protein ACXABY_36080 [Candidatus Thorarchaeota archaeon]|jgi:hypothetical protein
MKGFMITIVSVSLIMLLVVLSSMLYDSYLSMERALIEPRGLSYGAFLFDDVAENVEFIVGTDIMLTQTNASTVVRIKDELPKENFSSTLLKFEEFLEDEVERGCNGCIGILLQYQCAR